MTMTPSIRKLVIVQIVMVFIFLIFKLSRQTLRAYNASELGTIFLGSFPNFCEGIVGVLTVSVLALIVNRKLKLSETLVFSGAILFSALYVITQELEIHNLGGKNDYDFYDVVFSILGLTVGGAIVFYVKPRLASDKESD